MKNNNIDRILQGAIYNNCYRTFSPYPTGFNSHTVDYQQLSHARSIAEEFLVNTRHDPNSAEDSISIFKYLDDIGVQTVALNEKRDTSAYQRIKLPQPEVLDIALGEAMVNRKSIKHYTGDYIDFTYLSTLLKAGNGISRKAMVKLNHTGKELPFHLRTVASAGALYPINLYVVALRVKGLKQGIYKYNVLNDELLKIADQQKIKHVRKAISSDDDLIGLSQASLIILLTANAWKTMKKYGDRGLRFVFQEAGAISQNINLAVQGLGLGSVDCASFYDKDIHDILNIDGMFESFLHAMIIGMPS